MAAKYRAVAILAKDEMIDDETAKDTIVDMFCWCRDTRDWFPNDTMDYFLNITLSIFDTL